MGMAVELGGGEAKAAGRCARALLQAQSNTLTALSKRPCSSYPHTPHPPLSLPRPCSSSCFLLPSFASSLLPLFSLALPHSLPRSPASPSVLSCLPSA
eukprot:1878968-Rhodomonas_salina.1